MSNNNNTSTPLASQLRAALQPHRLPPPSQTWLQALVASRNNPPPPLPSLVMTAKTRLLASDLTSPGLLDPTQLAAIGFPPDVVVGSNNPVVANKQVTLRADVWAQVLDVEDLARSRWDQVEALEAVARGEFTRGREVIRLGGGGENGAEEQQTQQQQTQQQGLNSVNSGKNATHRLILQDCRGNKVYALELVRVPKIGIGSTQIGEKILLKKGAVVARGAVMLEPATCEILGGKVEAWQKAWSEGRLARLKGAVADNGDD